MLLTDTNVKRKEVGTLDNLTSMTWFDKATISLPGITPKHTKSILKIS